MKIITKKSKDNAAFILVNGLAETKTKRKYINYLYITINYIT